MFGWTVGPATVEEEVRKKSASSKKAGFGKRVKAEEPKRNPGLLERVR